MKGSLEPLDIVCGENALLAIGEETPPPVGVDFLRGENEELNSSLKRKLVGVSCLVGEARPRAAKPARRAGKGRTCAGKKSELGTASSRIERKDQRKQNKKNFATGARATHDPVAPGGRLEGAPGIASLKKKEKKRE